MTTHSLAQEVIYEFFQETVGNTLHLSVRSKETGHPISVQVSGTDAIRMFASLSRIIPKMKNACKEPLGQEFIEAIVADQRTADLLSIHVQSHPMYCQPKNLERWTNVVVDRVELLKTLTEDNAEKISGHLEATLSYLENVKKDTKSLKYQVIKARADSVDDFIVKTIKLQGNLTSNIHE